MTPETSIQMADAFSRALQPAPETLAFYESLRLALEEIDAEEALLDQHDDLDSEVL
jgi:hypothetical protein